MEVTTNIDSIDKLNNEYIRKDVKKANDTETSRTNFAFQDSVEISPEALNLKDIQAAAMQAPDVRAEKVTTIKTRVDSGTYQVSHERLAEQMIEEAILE